MTTYTKQYKAFAKKHGVTCDLLTPFWAIGRRTADQLFDKDDTKPGYYGVVWATMETLVLKMKAAQTPVVA